MTVPPLSFLDVPHIADDIFDCLSFADLYNSVFVSRSWYSALIPRLWQDVVTFRPIPPLHLHAKTTYIHYFLSPAGRKSLIKHAHHIRALTCRGDALLPVLAKARMCGLIELNFIIEDQQSSASTATIPRWVQRTAPILDLHTLVQLIAMNPRLHSVSMENIDLDKEMECLALEEFVEAMDPFPSITSVFLNGKFLYKEQDSKSSLLTILERRLANVTNKVTSLEFGNGSQFTRSRRGQSSLSGAPKGLTYPGGRWENEKHLSKHPWDSLAILEHDGIMRICLPYAVCTIAAEWVLARFPELHKLVVNSPWAIPRNVFQVLPFICPNLRVIELILAGLDCHYLGNLLDDRRLQLSSVTLTGLGRKTYSQGLQPLLLLPTLHSIHHTLVEVAFHPGTFTLMSDLLEVLAVCQNLRMLSAEVSITGSETEKSPVWASKHLQSLQIRIRLTGEMRSYGGQRYDISLASASRLAPSFMQQMGQQTGLRTLSLTFDSYLDLGPSYFLTLSLGSANGLEQLANLSLLENFTVVGLQHEVGEAEIAWMEIHWPRLTSIELPIHQSSTSTSLSYILTTTSFLRAETRKSTLLCRKPSR